jgi:hypothetical protein
MSSDAVVAAARIFFGGAARGFGDESLLHELFQIVVQGAGTKFAGAPELARDFLHGAVAVAVFGGESEDDVLSGGGERHSRNTMHRNATGLSRGRATP